MNWILKIQMQSMLLPGAGGGSAVVDTETVRDEYGIPYIPGRRLKGVLRESALEASEMCKLAGLNWITESDVETAFGASEERLIVRDCRIEGYEAMKPWLAWCFAEHGSIVNWQSVLDWFTTVRSQTALDNGVAKDGALRNMRVIEKKLIFTGVLENAGDNAAAETVAALACANLRRMGTLRNRGLGEVVCSLQRQDGGDAIAAVLANCRRGNGYA